MCGEKQSKQLQPTLSFLTSPILRSMKKVTSHRKSLFQKYQCYYISLLTGCLFPFNDISLPGIDTTHFINFCVPHSRQLIRGFFASIATATVYKNQPVFIL